MKRYTAHLHVLFVCILAIGAGAADAPSVPAVAMPAFRKYHAAVTTAENERHKAVEKARVTLVTELKAAQKLAMDRGDVDSAMASGALAKAHAVPTVPAATFAGSTWVAGPDRIQLNADGTITHSDTRYSGKWVVTGDRTVAIFFNHGYIDVWKFDQAGGAYKAVAFKQQREYDGALVK